MLTSQIRNLLFVYSRAPRSTSQHSVPLPIHPNGSNGACYESDYSRWGMETIEVSRFGMLHVIGPSGR